MLVQLAEFDFFETSVVRDCLIDELLQVIVELFEELDRLHLPHLFHLDIVKEVCLKALHLRFLGTTL